MPRTTSSPRRRTLQDVADAVGLSVNTVSRALRDASGVSDAARERIKAEAQRLGYVPNAHARSLVLGSHKMIGVILTDLANPFFNDLVTEIEEQTIAAGYTIVLLLSDEDPEREQDAVDTALQSGVDGILAVPVQGRNNPWSAVVHAGVPLVLMAREMPGLDVDLYSTDNEAGRIMTTEAALSHGARDIVLLEEDLRISTVTHRLDAYRKVLEAHGIPFDSKRIAAVPSRRTARGASLWRGEDAYRVVSDLLDTGRLPDAFLVGNDYFALGLYAALRERGIRVPDDVVVIGWGDYPFSRYLDPPLSTLRLPAVDVARLATTRLLSLLDGTAEPGPVVEYIPPELILRASTQR
ncbi:LacI family DNA-binding transcriptional regulator [uncultured Microbacterium sp.]|jgi:LacI family transcriptional regulator|uniref:LacI family DNA-binding transcriptional regulator n=1 Tax=uncultured Microbacterium sp. TaxID=191216 RepID=UPI0026269E76|nr:LacI family DNA-binding transcriptional regulator [uncultured Microbacterium sp.]